MADRFVKGREVFIADGATVIGDVQLGDHASVWFGAVLRADGDAIRVGERSNVQDGCVLHSDPGAPVRIGEETTIGHHAIVHGATVGNRTLIGMGSVLLNHVKVGNDCIVGAHTLLTAGSQIPDNSLVFGSPGKVIRQLTAGEAENNRQTALRYVKNGLRYLGRAGEESSEKAPQESSPPGSRLEGLRSRARLPTAQEERTLLRNLQVQQKIYSESILPLVEKVFAALEPIKDFFESYELNCTGEAVGKHADKSRILAELKSFFQQTQHRYFNINLNWNNLKNGRHDAFGYYLPLQIELESQQYHINRNNNLLKTYSKRYDEALSPEEQSAVAEEVLGKVLDYIENHLES